MVCTWGECVEFRCELIVTEIRRAASSSPLTFDPPNTHPVQFFCSPSSGPEWSRLRGALNPKMLKLHEVSTFAAVINEVVDDLLKRFELLRGRSEDGSTVSDVASEFYKFGFEGEWAVRALLGEGCWFSRRIFKLFQAYL